MRNLLLLLFCVALVTPLLGEHLYVFPSATYDRNALFFSEVWMTNLGAEEALVEVSFIDHEGNQVGDSSWVVLEPSGTDLVNSGTLFNAVGFVGVFQGSVWVRSPSPLAAIRFNFRLRVFGKVVSRKLLASVWLPEIVEP